jgi:hypothetical protein
MRIVWSFVWRKFLSVGNDVMRWRMEKSSSLGMPMSPPRNIQEVQESKLGDARGTPSSSTKISGHLSRHYIFVASYAMCYYWIVSLFLFSVLFCFVCCNKWLDHSIFVLERDTLHFHCLEHSSFHSYRSASALFC